MKKEKINLRNCELWQSSVFSSRLCSSLIRLGLQSFEQVRVAGLAHILEAWAEKKTRVSQASREELAIWFAREVGAPEPIRQTEAKAEVMVYLEVLCHAIDPGSGEPLQDQIAFRSLSPKEEFKAVSRLRLALRRRMTEIRDYRRKHGDVS